MFPSQTDISSFKVYHKNNVTDFQRNHRHKIHSRGVFIFNRACLLLEVAFSRDLQINLTFYRFFYYIWFLNEALNFISSFISTLAIPFWCLIWCSNGDVHFFNFSISISNGNILIFVPFPSFDFEHSSFYPARTFDQCLFYALQMEWCFFFHLVVS